MIYHFDPDYPPVAERLRIQGTVRFEAVIGTEGWIKRLRLIRGHSLLVPAARDAVFEWRYEPTPLDGEPVEVVTTMKVEFRRNGSPRR